MTPKEEGVQKVLILDDSKGVAETIRDTLVVNDFDALAFADPRSVLHHLEHEDQNYDLLILDINLPGVSGITLAGKIRRELDLHIPVLFVSGELTSEKKKKIQRMGPGYACLEKGFSADKLMEVCLSLIGEGRVYTELGAVRKTVKCIDQKLEAYNPSTLLELTEKKQREFFASEQVTCKKFILKELDSKVMACVVPSSLISRWAKDPLVWFICVLLLILGGSVEEWVRYTYNVANHNNKEIRVLQEGMKSLKALPGKIDKLLLQIGNFRKGD